MISHSWKNLFSFKYIKEIHELRDLAMPLNHPMHLYQDKFSIKDEELKISIIISCHVKGVVKP